MSALTFKSPLTTWIFSDPHAFHKNICKGTTLWETSDDKVRDFDNPDEMTQKLVDNINARVMPNHDLICLGDWSFGGFTNVERFRKMILCENIYFVAGNHDHHIQKHAALKSLFKRCWAEEGVHFQIEIRVGNHKYVCGHFKPAIWNKSHHGVRALWGHSHDSYPDSLDELSFDVGVDAIEKWFPGDGFRPINFVEVEKIISQKKWKPIDHHTERTN